jgi:hypothetical protein
MLFRLRHDPHPKENAKDDETSDGKKNGVTAKKFGQHARDLLKKPDGESWRFGQSGARGWGMDARAGWVHDVPCPPCAVIA